jgi:hypothetical protein
MYQVLCQALETDAETNKIRSLPTGSLVREADQQTDQVNGQGRRLWSQIASI